MIVQPRPWENESNAQLARAEAERRLARQVEAEERAEAERRRIEEARSPAAYERRVLAYVRAHPGASSVEIRAGVAGTSQTIDAARRRLTAAGQLVRVTCRGGGRYQVHDRQRWRER